MSNKELVVPENAPVELVAAVKVINYLWEQPGGVGMTEGDIQGSKMGDGSIVVRYLDRGGVDITNTVCHLLKDARHTPVVTVPGILTFLP
jgi:hypothetical protein